MSGLTAPAGFQQDLGGFLVQALLCFVCLFPFVNRELTFLADPFEVYLENLVVMFIIRDRYASQMDFCSSLFTFSFLTQNDLMGPPLYYCSAAKPSSESSQILIVAVCLPSPALRIHAVNKFLLYSLAGFFFSPPESALTQPARCHFEMSEMPFGHYFAGKQ